MATSPVPQWAMEMSPHHRGPTAAGVLVLVLAVVAVLVAVLLQFGAVTDSGRAGSGQRVQSPACAELQRLQAHGVHAGASWRRAARACQEASGGR
jgi:hypothetical protein